MHFDMIAFDADDTLWANEPLYQRTQAALAQLLQPYGIEAEQLNKHLFFTETNNLPFFGYGIKSFTLSMIQAAVELTEGRFSKDDILAVIELARQQVRAPVELLQHARATVSVLAKDHRLMVITKGDLGDQEGKMARSGLGEFFHDIEVVSDKTVESYARLFANHALVPEKTLMVGDSLRSDILPVLELGGWAVHVPFHIVWEHEAAQMPELGTPRFHQLKHLGELPQLIQELENR